MSTEMRIGDAEREAAVAALGEHYAAGRLDVEEYDDRTSAAWAARSTAALVPLFADLPAPHPSPAGRVLRPENAPHRPAWRPPIAAIPLIALLVSLAVVIEIPWFAVAMVALVWIFGAGHGRWHHGGPWPAGRLSPRSVRR